MSRMDLTGDTYNDLTVIEFSHRTPKNSMAHYHCRCSCGNKLVVSHGHLRSGHTKSCGCLRAKLLEERKHVVNPNAKYFVGQRFYSKKWGLSIVKQPPTGSSKNKGWIEFVGDYPCEVYASLSNLAKGLVKNPMQPIVCGKGYIGVGKYSSKDSAYNVWFDMLYRCYTDNPNTQKYTNTVVSEHWLNFQSFAKDYYELLSYVSFSKPQLDKDLLSGLDRGKIYSKETCCILPHRINTALQLVNQVDKTTDAPFGVSLNKQTGKYKSQISINREAVLIGSETASVELATGKYRREKSKYIISLAEEYKNQLPFNTYSALLNKAKEIFNETK